MDEQREISRLLGKKRDGDGLEKKEELGFIRHLDSDANNSYVQSDTNNGVVLQPNLSSEQMFEMPVTPDAEDLGRVVKENELLGIEASTVLETSTCLPKTNSISTEDDRCIANSGNQDLLENHTVKDDSNCELQGGDVNGVSNDSSLVKPRDDSKSVGSSSQISLLHVPTSEKSDSMRRWMEMKLNGYLSVQAPAPAQKQQTTKGRGGSVKKRNEVLRLEKPQVDRFPFTAPPSGLLGGVKPAIIRHVRSKEQVHSFLKALIGNATGDATVEETHANLNVKESVREDNANSITNQEQTMSLTVEAATVASQWLGFLHQDFSGRLSAVQKSRNRVQSFLTIDLPLLFSSMESSSNQESTSGDASSDKTVTETHKIWWTAKFELINKNLCDEERDLERSLNQVKEMQSQCNEGLRQVKEVSPLSSKPSDSSNLETNMAVQAAAASIISTSKFLLSMRKPPRTGS